MYQVSFDISEEKTKNREINGFQYFQFHHKTKKYLITYDTNESINDIDIISIDKFYLDTK